MFWFILHYAGTIQPCQYEDGSEMKKPGQMCIWKADERVNQQGDSFIAIRAKNGDTYYFYEDDHLEIVDKNGEGVIAI